MAYEELLITSSIDYVAVDPKKVSADTSGLDAFLSKRGGFATIRHNMHVSLEQLAGYLSSASYTPLPGHLKYASMMDELREIFTHYHQSGTVSLDFEMKIYYGQRVDPSER
jgi:hypothetical protein